jgi:hypothetical protein
MRSLDQEASGSRRPNTARIAGASRIVVLTGTRQRPGGAQQQAPVSSVVVKTRSWTKPISASSE